MGQTYSVILEMKVTDEAGAIKALHDKIADGEKDRTDYNVEHFRQIGVDTDTLEGLRREIEKAVNEAISKELVEDKLVIKYSVTTKCSYAIDTDGEIIPNGCWRKDPVERGKEYGTDWREGNANSRTYGNLPSVSVFARVFHKKTYAYRSGRTIQKLEIYRPKIKDGRGSSSFERSRPGQSAVRLQSRSGSE